MIMFGMRRIAPEPGFIQLPVGSRFATDDFADELVIHRTAIALAAFRIDLQGVEDQIFVLVIHLGEISEGLRCVVLRRNMDVYGATSGSNAPGGSNLPRNFLQDRNVAVSQDGRDDFRPAMAGDDIYGRVVLDFPFPSLWISDDGSVVAGSVDGGYPTVDRFGDRLGYALPCGAGDLDFDAEPLVLNIGHGLFSVKLLICNELMLTKKVQSAGWKVKA